MNRPLRNFFFLLLLFFGVQAHADVWSNRMEIPAITSDDTQVEQAMRHIYETEGSPDADAAVAAVQKLADSGNAEAAFRLGRYYDVETPLPDYAKAAALYQKASDKGHGWALNNLGIFYERGNGVEKNLPKARKLYEASAKTGDHHGYLNLARMDMQGVDGPANVQKGLDTMHEALDKKIAGAFIDMSNIYRGGFFGVPMNRFKGLEYLREAAALGDAEAADHMAFITLYGDCAEDAGFISHLHGGVDCVPGSPRKGFAMLSALAAKNNPEATTDLGSAYWEGAGVAQDTYSAIDEWQRAGELGDCRAYRKLANAFKEGKYITPDDTKALTYLSAAVECNPRDAESLYHLGQHYFAKSSPDRDCAKAESYLQRAVANGERRAYTDLGFIYDRGCAPIAPDKKKAFGYYLIGAKLGVAVCQNNVGAMLKHGAGVEKDLPKSYGWLQVAAGNGSGIAKKSLEDYDYLFNRDQKQDGMEYMGHVKKMLADTAASPALAFDGKY